MNIKLKVGLLSSAAAQIAAMEAKLASMAKRKPIDEDYVPGQNRFAPNTSITPSGSRGVLPNPTPDSDLMDVDLDENFLGTEEGRKAAEDLEVEMEAALRGDGEVKVERGASPEVAKQSATALGDAGDDDRLASKPPVTTISSTDQTHSVNTSLPPKPSLLPSTATIASPVTATPDEAKVKREEAFKRGLAGLPKKPVL